jgi:hypothetical protein
MTMHKTFQVLAFLTAAAAVCGFALTGAEAQQEGKAPAAMAAPLPTPPALMAPLADQSSTQVAPATPATVSAPAAPASTLVNTPAQKQPLAK